MNILTPESPEFSQEIHKLETTDKAHADTFNEINTKLYHNTLYLKKELEDKATDNDIDGMFTD